MFVDLFYLIEPTFQHRFSTETDILDEYFARGSLIYLIRYHNNNLSSVNFDGLYKNRNAINYDLVNKTVVSIVPVYI